MKLSSKILIISGIGVLAILGIYLGWRAITSEPQEIEVPTSGETPSSPVVSLKKLSDSPVFDFWVNPSTNEVFYFMPDGRVFTAKDGPDLELSKQTINALNFIEVGPKNEKILAAFGDPHSRGWGIFDVVDSVWRPLPSEIVNAAWGKNNEKLIVIVKNGNDLNLAEADIAQTPPSYRTLVRDFRLKDIKLTYVPENRLIINELFSASYASSIWQLDLESLNFNLLVAPQRGLNVRWSKDKDVAFMTRTDAGLMILNNNLQTILLPTFISLPEKCTAGSQKIYCFVPQNIPSDTVLPDDYLMKKFFSIDNLSVLEVDSGEITTAFVSNTGNIPAVDAKNPQVLGDKIYFVNRYDNQLYELGL